MIARRSGLLLRVSSFTARACAGAARSTNDAHESMSERVRVYVNSRPVDVDTGGTMLDAVRASDVALGAAVDSGDRALTDSRGLPLDPRAVAYSGAIIRVVGARAKTDPDSES